jgi:hypothetical protein
MSVSKLVHGARAVVYINGKMYGLATAFSWSSSTPNKKVHCIDVPYPLELATTTADVSWQMTVLRTVGDGGAQGAGIVAQSGDLSRQKYFTILVVERLTDITLFKSDFCSTDSESWQLSTKSIMQGQISGSATQWVNESNNG